MSSKIGSKYNLPTLNISTSTQSKIDTYLNPDNDIAAIYYDISDKKLYFYNDIDTDTSNYRNIIINDISNIDLSDNVTIHGKLISIGDSSFNGNINVNDICLTNINSLIPGGTITFNDSVTFSQSVSYDTIATFGNSEHDLVIIINELDISRSDAVIYANDISLRNLGGLENDHFYIISDVSFQKNVEISNNLFVGQDVSINRHLRVPDASFQNNVNITNDLFVEGDVSINSYLFVGKDVSINKDLFVGQDVSINNDLFVGQDVSINNHLSVPDASFQNNVDIFGSLTVDGSFTFNELIYNERIVNTVTENKVVVSTILEISNNNTGHALKVTQYGGNDNNDTDTDIALFHAGNDGSAVEFIHNGNAIFYKDASFQKNVDITKDLFVEGDVSINSYLFVGQDVSINTDLFVGQDVSINKDLFVEGDVSINKHLIVPDASFNRIAPIDGSMTLIGDLSVNGNIYFSDNLYTNGELFEGGGGGSGTDASFDRIREFTDGSGITFLNNVFIDGDVSINGGLLSNSMELVPTGTLLNHKIFDETPALASETDTSWNKSQEILFSSGAIVIHNVKVSSFIKSGYVDWPDEGHEYLFSRKDSTTGQYGWESPNEYKKFKYIFDSQGKHEQTTYSFVEKMTSDKIYTDWSVDISGDGARNNSTDKLTWDVTVITPQLLNTSPNHIANYTLFDASAADDISTNTVWERPNQSVSIAAGSMVLHDIRVSGYIAPGYIDWPLEGHEFIFQRKTSTDASYGWSSDLSYQHVKHIFNAQEIHEEQTYSMLETIPNAVDYTYWKCDISGDGARSNNVDKLTWKIIIITPNDFVSNTAENVQFNNLKLGNGNTSSYSLPLDVSGDVNVTGNIISNDVSINNHLSVLDASFQNNVDVEGKLVVKDDVSFNAHMSVLDASFQNDVEIGGDIKFSDSTVQNTSSAVLEYISSYCDGTSISVKNPINVGGGSVGTIQTVSVTATFNTSQSWQLITGSDISYCPPPGTTLVIYEFNFQSRPLNHHKIMSIKFLLNDSELTQARQASTNYDHVTTGQSTFHHIKVPISATNWSSALDLRCQVYSLSGGHRATIHKSAYWMSVGGIFIKPSITLIAIK